MQKRIRDYGVTIGKLEPGKLNKITDVQGVKVGHHTLSHNNCQTGVTAILPHSGNLFREKLIAATHTINGFGKSMGTIQIDELGTIETPILLTNTLNSGTAFSALVDYMLEHNPEIGRTTGTVNPVIGECNDMLLNDVRAQFVTKEHVFLALQEAAEQFTEGAVGAGRGMLCYSLKGGIGSSSRKIELSHGTYTIGVLVLANFGILSDLQVAGQFVGRTLSEKMKDGWEKRDRGSVMIITATDLPLSERQLKRVIKRCVTGLSKTGSIITTGSGEIAIGFSTATRIPHEKPGSLLQLPTLHEDDMDECFRGAGEATEEAVLNALITADTVTGREGNERPSLRNLLEKFDISLT